MADAFTQHERQDHGRGQTIMTGGRPASRRWSCRDAWRESDGYPDRWRWDGMESRDGVWGKRGGGSTPAPIRGRSAASTATCSRLTGSTWTSQQQDRVRRTCCFDVKMPVCLSAAAARTLSLSLRIEDLW